MRPRTRRVGSTVRTSSRGAATLVIAGLALAACGGESGSGALPPADTPLTASTGTAAVSAAPSAVPASFSGIILGGCQGPASWKLTAIDPATGQMGEQRSFAVQTGGPAASFGCTTTGVSTGRFSRQQFNGDFTKMAVGFPKGADGSTHIGYMNLDGSTVDLTPQSSDYGDVPQQEGPMFNPRSGRIWFTSGGKLGSVDPEQGPSSSHAEKEDSFQNGVIGGYHDVFVFSPDGKYVTSILGMVYETFSPDGRVQVEYDPPGYGFKVGRQGKVDDTTETTEAPDGTLCWPGAFVNNTQFVCKDTSGGQLYLVTVKGANVTLKPLLPNSNLVVGDVVGDPSGRQVAFIAGSGSTSALYLLQLAGSKPHKIMDIEDDGSYATALMAWQ
jgi:hypothetical protein